MTNECKKMLFWWYVDNTPLEEIKPLEDLTIDYMLRCKLLRKGGAKI